MARVIYFDFII